MPVRPIARWPRRSEDPQIAWREAFVEVTDAGGPFKALNPPFRMTDSATRVGRHSAALGEHIRAPC